MTKKRQKMTAQMGLALARSYVRVEVDTHSVKIRVDLIKLSGFLSCSLTENFALNPRVEPLGFTKTYNYTLEHKY